MTAHAHVRPVDPASERDERPLRALFVNENIGGNATMHVHLRRNLERHDDVHGDFLDAAPRGPLRRGFGAAVPGLARLDLDLAPLRGQLGVSGHVRRRLDRWPHPYDVLHLYTHNAGLLSVGHLRRTPSIVGLDATTDQSIRLLPYRTPTRFTAAASRPARTLEQRVYDAADAIVVKSRWARRSLLGDYAVDPDRVHHIPYGITVPELPTVQRDDATIVFVGRSMERKGGWLLIDAWRRHLRNECQLLLITPEPVPPEPGLTVVDDLTPGDLRLFDLLASASVLAFPSTGDTFGYAALEAMSVGTPVVAARAAALPEIVTDGHDGRIVAPHDVDALAGALRSVLNDPAERDRMGAAARGTVLERFDARVTTQQLIRLMHTVVDR